MAIQTIGGAAASTGVQGTPVLKLQRTTTTASNYTVVYSETVQEYTLSSPLPPGTYFFTFTASSTSTQMTAVLDNGTLLTQVVTSGVLSTSATVPSGRTLAKIAFRTPVNNAWSSVLSLDVLVSTDTPGFYGQTIAATSANYTGPSYSLPSLPAGVYDVGSPNAYLSSSTIDSNNRYYILAHNRTNSTLNASTSGTSVSSINGQGDANTLVQSYLKLYEWNVATGVLTEKATPQFSNTVTMGVGWNPSSNPGMSSSGSSASVYHLQNSYLANANGYVHFIPGYAFLVASNNSTNWYGYYQYQNGGLYNKSTNTWSIVTGIRTQIAGITNYWGYATPGNDLVITPSIQYQTNYIGAESVSLYQWGWQSTANSNNYYHYVQSLNQWFTNNTGRSTSSSVYRANASFTPHTDAYVFVDPFSDPQSSGTANYDMYVYDVAARALRQKRYSGIYEDGIGVNDIYIDAKSFMTNSWFKDPTSTSHIYFCPTTYNCRTFFRLNLDNWASTSAGTSANWAWYAERTKWHSANAAPSSSNIGWVYSASPEYLIRHSNAASPNNNAGATKTNFGIQQLIGYPSYLSTSY
jgi:hypothetical protein